MDDEGIDKLNETGMMAEDPAVIDNQRFADDFEETDTETQIPKKPEKKINHGRFLNRQIILLTVFILIIVIIVVCGFILPSLKIEKKEDISLDKAGSIYIPDEISRYNPPAPPVSAVSSTEAEHTNATVDDIIATIPLSDESRQPNVAPPLQPSVVATQSTSTSTSSRPETNRNPVQKQVTRIQWSGGEPSAGQVRTPQSGYSGYPTGGYAAGSPSQAVESALSAMRESTKGGYEVQNAQNNKLDFAQSDGGGGMQFNGKYALWKGTVIPAVLETGINTDLPGVVMARVTSNVYSSLDGQYILIPQGSLLYATYNSSISYAQKRVQVAWNTLIRPDGLEIDLGNIQGVDAQGQTGYAGFRNDHPFEYAKALGLIAIYSLIDTEYNVTKNVTDNPYVQNVMADTYAAAQNLSGKIIDRTLDIQPTITVQQGTQIKLITNVTLTIPPLEPYEVTQKYVRQ